MTLRTPLFKRLLVAAAVSAGLSLVPLNPANQGLEPNDACAGGQCCMETQSFCGQLAGYYHALDKCGPSLPGGDDIQ